ncbi:DUF6666 family protein [Adhaeretor mobilis]|nr:DUF6666 family protein [Adhaeretor mobilis]
MKLSDIYNHASAGMALLALIAVGIAPQAAAAHHTGAQHIHFQKPNLGKSSSSEGVTFRSPSGADDDRVNAQRSASSPSPAKAEEPIAKRGSTTKIVRRTSAESGEITTKRIAKSQPPVERTPAYVADARAADLQRRANARGTQKSYRDSTVRTAGYSNEERLAMRGHYQRPGGYASPAPQCDTCLGGCTCEPGCGIGEPSCGIYEPGCGIVEPGCGIVEPGCGIYEPDCGIVEQGCGCAEPGCGICDYGPSCGVAEPACGCDTLGGCDACCGDGVGCGSCVDDQDYDCIPICIPRFKTLQVWGGVHAFKGPRDSFSNGPGDANFGFQEGVGISGRAPLIGLLFPELSYQLGYQGVQSRFSGTSNGDANDRSQHFVTGGFFRRVPVGLQFGAVFDFMRDDLIMEEDFHQIRYEVSLKSPKGREVGFWGASATNNAVVGGIDYEAVQQYAIFYRWHFKNGNTGRIWGGGTNDEEGLVGADFQVSLNDRWSLQTGFNYLITDAAAGSIGAREESWNVGTNLVWHWGKTARSGCKSRFRPLFNVADNGWMFIDQVR